MAVVFVLALIIVFAAFVWWVWRESSFALPLERQAHRPLNHDTPDTRESVLFVCTHNSARSQMAEALLRDMAGDRFRIASAGTSPTSVHRLAEAAMTERGLTLRDHRAKRIDEVGRRWDYVITLCDQAFEHCPDFPDKTCRLHWSIEDPSRPRETAAEQLEAFCRVADDLASRLRRWVAERLEKP